MLNAMRFGELSPEASRTFRALSRTLTYNDGIDATEMYVFTFELAFPKIIIFCSFSLRHEVATANETRLGNLRGEAHTYHACDTPGFNADGRPIHPDQMEKILDRLIVPR